MENGGDEFSRVRRVGEGGDYVSGGYVLKDMEESRKTTTDKERFERTDGVAVV